MKMACLNTIESDDDDGKQDNVMSWYFDGVKLACFTENIL